MAPAKILLDCDPGLDDALPLMLAHGDPDIDLVGVTTVGGNVGLARTTRNALDLLARIGASGVPVAAGAGAPLERPVANAEHVHGTSGLGGVSLTRASAAASDFHAVDVIIETLRASPGEVHLFATGPLTNIALALQRDPGIAQLPASFVIMGGSFTRGNATPAAEFNILADPEAAAVVFAAGWQVVMVGLDLTLQATVNPAIIERMRALGPVGDELLVPLSTYWVDRADPSWDGQAVHDVCAVAYVVRPDLFESRAARVEVETTGSFTAGMTVVDFAGGPANALVPVALDTAGFWDYALSCWARVRLADVPAAGVAEA